MVVTQIFLHWSPDPHVQTLRRCWMMCEFIWHLALSWHLGSLECLPAGPYQSPQRGDGRTPARISCVALIPDKPTRRTTTPGEAPHLSMGSSSQAKVLTSPHSIWKTNKTSWKLWMDQTKLSRMCVLELHLPCCPRSQSQKPQWCLRNLTCSMGCRSGTIELINKHLKSCLFLIIFKAISTKQGLEIKSVMGKVYMFPKLIS